MKDMFDIEPIRNIDHQLRNPVQLPIFPVLWSLSLLNRNHSNVVQRMTVIDEVSRDGLCQVRLSYVVTMTIHSLSKGVTSFTNILSATVELN